jgi:hypothetical protein
MPELRFLSPDMTLAVGEALIPTARDAHSCFAAQPGFGAVLMAADTALRNLEMRDQDWRREVGETVSAQAAVEAAEGTLRVAFGDVRRRVLLGAKAGLLPGWGPRMAHKHPPIGRIPQDGLRNAAVSLLTDMNPFRVELADLGVPAALDRLAAAIPDFETAVLVREKEKKEDTEASRLRRDALEGARDALQTLVERMALDGDASVLAAIAGVEARYLPRSSVNAEEEDVEAEGGEADGASREEAEN